MSKTTTQKKTPARRGRKTTINWGAAHSCWRSHTDKELAKRLECTVPSVWSKRRALIAQDKANGGDGSLFVCNRKAYDRIDSAKTKSFKKTRLVISKA